MARVGLRKVVFGLAATGLLIGCVDGGSQTGADGSQISAPTRAAASARDIEAPEVYQASDSALWDGRPSLGGIWVAAPDADSPERVAIFNPATGKTVTGALFKRERENPGPRLQLSSDAAEALGILAGQPTQIRVTALRKEEVKEAAPATEAAADVAVAAASDPAAAPAGEGTEAAAIASGALDAVESGTTKAAPAEGSADLSGEAVAAAAVAGAEAIAPDATPKKKTWKERRAEAKAAREAKRRAAADAKAAAAAAAAGTAVVEGEGEAPTTSPDAAAAALAPIESAPLDARSADVAEPAPSARKTVGKTPAPAPAAAPAVEAPAASGPARPIQVASFSKEENAKRAAEALAKIGVTATPQKSDTNGKVVWGVVVMGDDVMLKKIKDAGFADAYYLK